MQILWPKEGLRRQRISIRKFLVKLQTWKGRRQEFTAALLILAKITCRRANYIAMIWGTFRKPIQSFPAITECGWEDNLQIYWEDQTYPDDTAEHLAGEDEEELIADAEAM